MKHLFLLAVVLLMVLFAGCKSREEAVVNDATDLNSTQDTAAAENQKAPLIPSNQENQPDVKKTSYTKGTWLSDYNQALNYASELGRPVLLDFTGSDWCGWCMKLDEEVFSQPEFKDYASSDLILCKIDFPRNIPQSPAVKKANLKLGDKYNIEGYPTIILVDSKGKVINRTGYLEGGASAYVQHLRGLLGK